MVEDTDDEESSKMNAAAAENDSDEASVVEAGCNHRDEVDDESG